MRRAPWPVGLLFGLGVALLIVLAGPLLLFNPWFVDALQARHEVAERLAVSDAEVDRMTGDVLVDLYFAGDFDVTLPDGTPLLDARERSHMSDVAGLFRLLVLVAGVAGGVVAVTHAALRADARRVGAILLAVGGGLAAAALLLALVFAVAFEPAFLAFHTVFFPPGTYLFGPDSNLIRLFPGGFWFDASLVAGATIVVPAALLAFAGWRMLRAHGA
jgi:uncharacterized membrane protein